MRTASMAQAEVSAFWAGTFGRILKRPGCCSSRGASLSSATCFVSALWPQEWTADSQCHMPVHILKEDRGGGDAAEAGAPAAKTLKAR